MNNLFDKKPSSSYYDGAGRNTLEGEHDRETLKALIKNRQSVGDLRRGV